MPDFLHLHAFVKKPILLLNVLWNKCVLVFTLKVLLRYTKETILIKYSLNKKARNLNYLH